MIARLPQDASSSIDGILYQYYSILNYCFEMKESDVLYIEKFGDIRFADKNIEVKKYETKLGDTHKNFWKTLFNWTNETFDHSCYKHLILLTTQEYTYNSTLVGFNSMSNDERFSCVSKIKEKHRKKIDAKAKKAEEKKKEKQDAIIKYMDCCFEEEHLETFRTVLPKVKIINSAPSDKELFDSISSKYANNITVDNRLDYLRALLGWVIAPREDGLSKWEVKKDEFDKQCIKLTHVFSSLKKVFPFISNDEEKVDISSYEDHVFIRKIRDIEYDSVVAEEAIYDYVDAKRILTDDYASGSVLLDEYNKFRAEEYRTYKAEYRRASRNTSEKDLIKDSQDLYDTVTNKEANSFMEYINNAPKRFRNGTLHIIADEDNDRERLIWRLKVNDDE